MWNPHLSCCCCWRQKLAELQFLCKPERQAGQDPVYYRISNSTHIAKVPMRRHLSHSETKNELSSYLAEKFLDHAKSTRFCGLGLPVSCNTSKCEPPSEWSRRSRHQDVTTCSGRNCQRCEGAVYPSSRHRWICSTSKTLSGAVLRHPLSLVQVISIVWLALVQ